jgi:hypothetical protein
MFYGERCDVWSEPDMEPERWRGNVIEVCFIRDKSGKRAVLCAAWENDVDRLLEQLRAAIYHQLASI